MLNLSIHFGCLIEIVVCLTHVCPNLSLSAIDSDNLPDIATLHRRPIKANGPTGLEINNDEFLFGEHLNT